MSGVLPIDAISRSKHGVECDVVVNVEVLFLATHSADVVVKVILRATVIAVKGVEPPSGGHGFGIDRAEVPLADGVRLVAECFEPLREHGEVPRHGVGRSKAAVRVVYARVDHVATRHDARSRRRADRLDIISIELHASRGEGIHVRRRDLFAPVESNVVEAEVIGDDE